MRRLVVCCLALLPGWAWSEGFTTQETVELVVICMDEIGGQSEANLYACACRHDYINADMGHDMYARASIFERYSNMPADKGQLFRDSKEGDELRHKLNEVRKQAAVKCPLVKQIVAPAPLSN